MQRLYTVAVTKLRRWQRESDTHKILCYHVDRLKRGEREGNKRKENSPYLFKSSWTISICIISFFATALWLCIHNHHVWWAATPVLKYERIFMLYLLNLVSVFFHSYISKHSPSYCAYRVCLGYLLHVLGKILYGRVIFGSSELGCKKVLKQNESYVHSVVVNLFYICDWM